jgi:cell division protein FtsB
MTSYKPALKIDDSSRVNRVMKHAYEQRRRFATVAAAVLAVAVGYHVVFGQNGLTAYEQKKADALALSDQLRMLTDENEALKGHVERLQSDPAAIEHQAREELHYTRPGEVIVTLPLEPLRQDAKR